MKIHEEIKYNSTLYGKILEVKVDKTTGQAFVKVQLNNGEILGGLNENNDDKDNSLNLAEINYKLIKHAPDSEAFIQSKHDSSVVAGSEKNAFITTKTYGNFITGSTTFTAHPESIKMGGVYRINGLHTSTMASTIITPIPLFILDIPGKQLVQALNNTLKEFKQILEL